MTKIKNYPLDLEVNGGDKWIGTDSQSLAKLTKNFTPDNLAKYYNDKEVINMVNAMRFVYDTVDPGDERISGGLFFSSGGGACGSIFEYIKPHLQQVYVGKRKCFNIF